MASSNHMIACRTGASDDLLQSAFGTLRLMTLEESDTDSRKSFVSNGGIDTAMKALRMCIIFYFILVHVVCVCLISMFISDDPLCVVYASIDHSRRGAAELIIKPCLLAARICCTFSPTTFSSVQFMPLTRCTIEIRLKIKTLWCNCKCCAIAMLTYGPPLYYC